MIFTKGSSECVDGRAKPSHGLWGLFLRGVEAERHSAVRADDIRYEVGQHEFGEVEALPREQHVALVDQIEDRADDQRYPQ
jgi:hypothetical protein